MQLNLVTNTMTRRTTLYPLALLAAFLMNGWATTSLYAQSPAYSIFQSELSSLNGAYRSAPLTGIQTYIDGIYTPLDGRVAVKITGSDGWANSNAYGNVNPLLRIDGFMELYSEYGRLLIYFETESFGGYHTSIGTYTIVDGGGMYGGASGGGGLEIITDGVTFSDPRSPWYFHFGY